MPAAFLILIGCELLGEILRSALHLPLPGSVIGMLLLAGGIALRDRGAAPDSTPTPSALDRTASALLANMGMLFVPAGVGIIAEAGLLRTEWKPIVVAVIGSTLLGLMVTGFVMHRLLAPQKPAPQVVPPIGQPTGAAP
jgi:holin-like protein